MSRTKLFARGVAASCFLQSLGCVLWIREPESYRDEVVEQLEPQQEAIEVCYDNLIIDEQLAIEQVEREAQGKYADIGPAVTEQIHERDGKVVLDLEVEAETGVIKVAVNEATTAPEAAVACVTEAFKDLSIQPGDERIGQLQVELDLKVGKHSTKRPTMVAVDAEGNVVEPAAKPESEAAAAESAETPNEGEAPEPAAEKGEAPESEKSE